MANISSSASDSKLHFENIDILRGFAAIIVMLYHVVVLGNFITFPHWGPFQIIRNGWMGVILFFVISGFVITLSLGRENITNPITVRVNFMVRRWFRIAPLYYFTILIFVSFLQPHLIFLPARSLAAHFGTHLLFIHNLFPQTQGSIDGPNWTIALEMQFYLLMALLIRKLFTWKISKLAVLFCLSAWIWRFSTTLYLEPGNSDSNIQSYLSNLLPGVLDQFLVGILLAILWIRSEKENSKFSKLLEKSARNFSILFLVFIVLFSLCLRMVTHIDYWGSTLMIVFFRSLLAITFGLLVLASITFPIKKLPFLLPFRYLGKISYGIYLWHIIVLSTILDRMPWLSGYKLMLTVCGFTLSLASMSYHLIEKPMITKGQAFLKMRNKS